MKQYIQSLKDILEKGHLHKDRTGKGRISIFGYQERYDLSEGFPLVTTRQIFPKAMISELLWFIQGETNTKKGGCPNFWDKWAVTKDHVEAYVDRAVSDAKAEGDQAHYPRAAIISGLMDTVDGSIGPMYGNVWRNAPVTKDYTRRTRRTLDQLPSDKLKLYKEEYDELMFLNKGTEVVSSFEQYAVDRYYQTVDQINELIHNLKDRPFSSRHCITAWMPEYVPPEDISPQDAVLDGFGCLAPCHAFFQFFVRPDKDGGKPTLDCQMYQRSCDVPVGKPYNIAQYALLTSLIAQVVDMVPGELVITTGDMHIYADQVEKAKEQILREPLELPKLWINPDVKDLFKFTVDDIKIEGYNHHPRIDYPVAV